MRRAERTKRWLWVAATVVATALAVLLVANLSLGDKHIEQRVETIYGAADPQFRRNMNVMFGPPLAAGNRARALVNGDAFFADMLESARAAKRTITLESYSWWSREIGADLTRARVDRPQGGVKVHLVFAALVMGKID